jgi:S1-C subfamily serine protease
MKKITKPLFFLIVGFAGAFLALHLFSSKYIEKFLIEGRSELAPIQLTEVREITIKENDAIVDAIEKVSRSVIGVKSLTSQGSGVIISSDGLAITLAEFIPTGSSFSFHINGKSIPYEIKKRDLAKNLVLVKVEGNGLPTLEFSDDGSLRPGERVFLVGSLFDSRGAITKSVNEGIIKRVEGGKIITNIEEEALLNGSILFDIKGRVLGINSVTSDGKVVSIPISTIREFAGL